MCVQCGMCEMAYASELLSFHLDIVSGNMKAIMRLILALAAHFKPSSVRVAAPEPARGGRRLRRSESSLSAVAADAAATLHDVSRAAASAGTPYKGFRFRYVEKKTIYAWIYSTVLSIEEI